MSEMKNDIIICMIILVIVCIMVAVLIEPSSAGEQLTEGVIP